MKPLRIGVLGGAGQRGQELIKLFNQPEKNVLVAAIADINLAALKDLPAVMPSLRLYSEAYKLFEDPELDAVVICVPDYLHADFSCIALGAGKHVYLEKPMGISPTDCYKITEYSKLFKKMVYVGHNLRHFTFVQKLKEQIAGGYIGQVKAIWCRHPVSYGHWAYFKTGRWHQHKENSGSLLIHKGCHDIDVIHWLAGSRTKKVVAMGALTMWDKEKDRPDVEDMSSVLMELENGVQANYAQCHFAFHSSREYMIHGTEGTLFNATDQFGNESVYRYNKRGKNLLGTDPAVWRLEKEEGFHGKADQRVVDEFIGLLRGTAKPTIALEEAAWAVKTAYAATASLRNGNIPFEVK